CRGGAPTTACGPTTSRMAIRLGPNLVKSSPGTWVISPSSCVLNSCGKTLRDFTTFRCQVPSKNRLVSRHIGGVDCDPRTTGLSSSRGKSLNEFAACLARFLEMMTGSNGNQ